MRRNHATGDQPHAVAAALQPEAIAVVFHFMEPVVGVRDTGRWEAEMAARLRSAGTSAEYLKVLQAMRKFEQSLGLPQTMSHGSGKP